jgi:pimeloyl-ACP methyl ester carboxylesterase
MRFPPYLAAIFWVFAAQVDAKSPAFDPRDCPPEAAAVGARCGVVHVPENPARSSGRKIPLSVLVLPATGPVRHAKRAQFDLEGGPGFAATDFLAFYAGEGAIYRQSHDIVLADMRGTGNSNPLRCAGVEELERRQPTALLYPPALVKECAQQTQVASDPHHYTTAAAARDIEYVRRALSYDTLDLNAISYGTTLALQYMADFPKRVSSAVLMGTVPAARTPPRFHAIAAQAAFDRLAADCAADAACHASFGDVRATLHAVLERLATNPSLPPAVFLEKLRTLMYSPGGRARIPKLLRLAAQGDLREFTAPREQGRSFADGSYLSITCAESFANMDVAAAIAASRDTLFGAYRLERQAEACRHWPASPPAPRAKTAKASHIPVLFIAGELDPVSPADWARETAAGFPRGVFVSVPQGAHVLDGLTGLDTCLDAVILRFMADPSRELDTSCFAGMTPPPFQRD